jgi:peptide/nickel transport system permease protein
MLNYASRRLLMLIPLLFFVSFFIFSIMKLTPGDAAEMLLGERATAENLAAVRAKYALDKPFVVQYGRMMQHLITGELQSIYYKDNVIALALRRLPASLELGLFALLISVSLAVSAGVLSAVRRNSLFDYVARTVAMFGISIPVFYIGILLIFLFAVKLKILPASGYGGHFWTWEGFRHLILPASALGFALVSSTTRLTRSAMLDVIRQDYVRTARAKGASERVVIWKHAFRNAVIPVLTNVGNQLALVLAGAVLTETVFAWPGIGRLIINAVFRRDEPMVFGGIVLLAAIYVVVNLLVDLLYSVLNPQITYD